jgi:hypothetical protein
VRVDGQIARRRTSKGGVLRRLPQCTLTNTARDARLTERHIMALGGRGWSDRDEFNTIDQ